MPAETGVAIAGAGPAGLALAVLLAARGVPVEVLEARHFPVRGSRAIGLHPPALSVLAAAGVADRAVTEGVSIRDGAALARGRTLARLDFSVLGGPHPFVLALPQERTLALLRERLAALAPGSLHWGVPVERVGRGRGGGAVVHYRAGADSGVLRARYVVAADGARSALRAAAGLDSPARTYPDRYLMGDFPDSTDHGATAALYLHPDGIVESFPLPGGLRRWVVRLGDDDGGTGTPIPGNPAANGGDADVDAAKPGAGNGGEAHGERRHLAAEVLRRTGHRLDPAADGMTSRFGTRRRLARSAVSGPLVLAGDAAHEISPIGGQGMTLGLADAAELAPLLAAGVAGTDPGPDGWAGYSARRLAAARTAAWQAEVNMALGRPLPPRVFAARAAALGALVRRPAAARWVARRFAMLA